MKNILITTNIQKILDFLIQDPGKEYLSSEIMKAVKISKAGTNFALIDLVKLGLLRKEERGRVYLYKLEYSNPVIKQLKVLRTLITLNPIIEKIKNETKKIILYGSTSRGEDTKNSDIDLFIVTNSVEIIEKRMKKVKIDKKIQILTRTPLKYIEMEKTEPVFNKEIDRGIILWESRDES